MAHFKHYLEVFRHHLNCFWPFQWKWKENVIFNKICLLFWTPFCNWPYSGHIYYLENVPVGPISPVWPLNVIWDFKNLIWSHKISIEIVLLLRHCATPPCWDNFPTFTIWLPLGSSKYIYTVSGQSAGWAIFGSVDASWDSSFWVGGCILGL